MQQLADFRWQVIEISNPIVHLILQLWVPVPSLAKSTGLHDLFLSHRKDPSSPTQKRDAALRELHCVPDMASRAW